MMLGEAEDLLVPYLHHPEYKKLKKSTPRLQELIKQIQEAIQKRDTTKKSISDLLGSRFIEVDEKTSDAFREIANICEEKLR